MKHNQQILYIQAWRTILGTSWGRQIWTLWRWRRWQGFTVPGRSAEHQQTGKLSISQDVIGSKRLLGTELYHESDMSWIWVHNLATLSICFTLPNSNRIVLKNPQKESQHFFTMERCGSQASCTRCQWSLIQERQKMTLTLTVGWLVDWLENYHGWLVEN